MEEKKILSREEVNENFKNLLNGEEFSVTIKEVPNIKAAYDEAHRLVYKQQEEAFDKAQEEAKANATEENPFEAEKFKFEPDEASFRFKELMTIFNDKKKEYKKALAQKEEANFNAKTAVVEKMKALTEQELTNFGETFNTFKTLQEEWKSIGEVNKARFQSLQTEYSHLMDKFFYNVNIHKGLQNYSFEKNKVEKQAITDKLKELLKNDSIIQLEHYIKLYQKEWDEIGPTFQEDWESLKTAYWENVNAVYAKIREHYLKIREAQKASIEKKEAIITESKTLLEMLKESQNPSKWNELGNKLKELQQNWRKTGFSKKSKDDELWNEFKTISNTFFDDTKQLYNSLNEKRSVFEDKKKALIAKANELKSSKNWKETTQQFLKLQDDWKKSGSLNPKKDQKLWNTFRAACNEFFDAKKEFFGGMDARQEENLKQKTEINKKIESAKTAEELNEQIAAWWALGHVPKKEISKANTAFDKSVNNAAKNLKIEDADKERIVFKAKIAAFKKAEDGDVFLEREKRFVKEKMDKLKDEIVQFENNLSFFGDSKGAQKLKEVVLKRVEESQKQFDTWKEKFKML